MEAGPTKLYTSQATLVIIYSQSDKLLLERTPNAFFKDTAPASDMEESGTSERGEGEARSDGIYARQLRALEKVVRGSSRGKEVGTSTI